MTDLIKNFHLDTNIPKPEPVPEDDPRDLVGLAAEMRLLRDGMVSWARELERFRGKW